MSSITTAVQDTPQYQDQKAGTSGLRKPTQTFLKNKNYLHNYVQSTLSAVAASPAGVPETLVVGGDGRYYCPQAAQIIISLAAGNGVKHVIVGQNALLSTPAVSALVRSLPEKPDGAFILTASHNPGGENADFGIKYNGKNGGPAQESLTNAIFTITKEIKSIKWAEVPAVDLSKVGSSEFDVDSRKFKVSVIDSVNNYAALMQTVFDFAAIKKNLFDRKDFKFAFDCLNGIAGPYARRIFVDLLGAPAANVRNATPLENFGGLHPDPNLTYATELVKLMALTNKGERAVAEGTEQWAAVPDFGAAADGDADRNMVLGKGFFVTPSDSVAIIAANANSIPFFKSQGGLKSVARSMPTSRALDLVAQACKFCMFEVPTGWKFFGNLMDSDVVYGQEKYTPLICGEESFGTGSDHVREKDGIWAVLAWLSILAERNNAGADKPLVTVEQIVKEHWQRFGRNYYARLDYEGIETAKADALMAHLRGLKAADCGSVAALALGGGSGGGALPAAKVEKVDDFCYTDPVDKSVSAQQGVRILFDDGSRYVFRLSGTGSTNATIRLYVESYVNAEMTKKLLPEMPPTLKMLDRFIQSAKATSKLQELTGREEPTVIT